MPDGKDKSIRTLHLIGSALTVEDVPCPTTTAGLPAWVNFELMLYGPVASQGRCKLRDLKASPSRGFLELLLSQWNRTCRPLTVSYNHIGRAPSGTFPLSLARVLQCHLRRSMYYGTFARAAGSGSVYS